MQLDSPIDPDIVAFIEAQPREMAYSQLAKTIRDRFGEARMVDEARLRDWWCVHHPTFARSRIGRDREVRDFILDLAGRLSGGEIAAALAAKFPAARLPSRTGLYRFLSEIRSEQRQPKP